MNLRPIESMGLNNVLTYLGLDQLGVEARLLPERLPSTARNRDVAVHPPGLVLVADPLAIYVFTGVRESQPELPDDAIGLGIWAPRGDTLNDGFVHQKFLVLQCTGDAMPQGDPVLLTEEGATSIEDGLPMEGQDGPTGIATGLVPEIPYALAALQSVVPPAPAPTQDRT